MSRHRCKVYNTLDQLVENYGHKARKMWRRHIDKHGNVPYLRKCLICSGGILKLETRLGIFRVKRLSKRIRDEVKYETMG